MLKWHKMSSTRREFPILRPRPLRAIPLVLLGMSWFGSSAQTHPAAQATTPMATSSATETSEVPQVPGISGLLHGVNAGLSISGLHDAQTGWATLAQPAIGYSFNDIFSLDITVPIYMYRLAGSRELRPRLNALLVNQRAEPGDVIFSLHGQFLPPHFQYQATVSATAPTGDTIYGLSTGRATFDLSNHLDHAFRYGTTSIELGMGDSSTLINPLVTRNFTSLGPLAHFQAGIAVPLFWGLSFDTNGYEQLPIGDQKIYKNVTRRGQTTLVVSGRRVTEDNGFTNALDIPLDSHTTLSAYYSHSLRFHDDVVSFGVTYVLRGLKSAKEKAADDDRLLQSVHQEIQTDDGAVVNPQHVPRRP
jgi:hypothetical protein